MVSRRRMLLVYRRREAIKTKTWKLNRMKRAGVRKSDGERENEKSDHTKSKQELNRGNKTTNSKVCSFRFEELAIRILLVHFSLYKFVIR